jgi:hypothetical protein
MNYFSGIKHFLIIEREYGYKDQTIPVEELLGEGESPAKSSKSKDFPFVPTDNK